MGTINIYKNFFEKSYLPMMILKDKKFIDCNEAALKLFRAKDKIDLINRHPGEFSPDFQPNGLNSKNKANNMIENALKNGVNIFEWIHKTLDGKLFWAMVTLTKIKFGYEDYISAIVLDITDFKIVKENLSISLVSINEAIIGVDKNKKINLFNPSAELLTGYSFNEAFNQPFNKIVKLYKINKKQILSDIFNCKELTKPNKAILISKEQNKYIVEYTVSEKLTTIELFKGFIIVIRDITDIEKMEQELIKVNTLEKIGILAGGIAHDFNNLLTGIYGNLTIIKLKNNSSEIDKYIEKIEKSLDNAKYLTNELLTFSRGGTPLKKVISLKELLKELPDFFIRGTKIKLIKEIPDNLWKTSVDKGQISQAISNLIINAIEAMPEGGELLIKAENFFHNHDPKLLSKGNFIKITIKDTGKGIPKEILDKIFVPFFTTKKKGTGLGLAIAYSIIEKHNGVILVNSEIGKGTVFTIYLPVSEINQEEDLSSSIIKKNKEKIIKKEKFKVLVMDDIEEVRDIFIDMLNILNCEVDSVENGDMVLEKLKSKKYDLIILDLTIPGGKGGKEIIGDILKIDSNAKVIATTGYSINEVFPNYKKFGFIDVLKKPFTFQELKDTIEKNIYFKLNKI